MRTEEAISYLTIFRKKTIQKGLPISAKAIQLGIEALKRVYDIRKGHDEHILDLLTGETEEVTK